MKYSRAEKKKLEKQREEIIYSLPAFINQVLLLSDCGLVLSSCIKKMGETYEKLPEERQNYFTKSIVEIVKESEETNESVVNLFQRFARFSGVKELTRVGNILMENKNKGTDLWNKLEEQSDHLWEERKRLALTRIKLADSKMSFPLGIMLCSLIIVTAAPSFLQMA